MDILGSGSRAIEMPILRLQMKELGPSTLILSLLGEAGDFYQWVFSEIYSLHTLPQFIISDLLEESKNCCYCHFLYKCIWSSVLHSFLYLMCIISFVSIEIETEGLNILIFYYMCICLECLLFTPPQEPVIGRFFQRIQLQHWELSHFIMTNSLVN